MATTAGMQTDTDLNRSRRHCLLAPLCFPVSGWQSPGVEVWEREVLVRSEMQFSDRDPELKLDDIFISAR